MRLYFLRLHPGLLLIFLAAMLHATMAWPATGNDDAGQAWYAKSLDWLESNRRHVGDVLERWSRSLDTYLSKDPASDQESHSSVRLRMAYVFEEDAHIYPNNDIKLKLDLPKSRNRWSLIFETDPDELESLEEQEQDNKATERGLQNTDESIGGFRVLLNDWRYWKNDVDVGVKSRLPLDPFVRFNTRRRYQLDENWGAGIKHTWHYFHEEGFGYRSSLVFDRPLGTDWIFFNTLQLRWQDEGAQLEYGDIVAFRQQLTDRDMFLYRTGIFYQQHPETDIQSYFVDMTYRRRLHSYWLYGELIPSVIWAKKQRYNDTAALTFRIEITFD